MKILNLFLLFLVIHSHSVKAKHHDDIEKLKKELSLTQDDIVGLSIIEANKEIYSYNGKTEFIPASTFKILAAYYILEKLGPNFRFKTTLGYNGKIESQKLKGDLILEASGDPYLLTSDLYNMALSLREKGIKEISGDLIVSSDFPSLKRIGHVGLDDQPYNQGISSLNINFNRFKAIRTKNGADAFPKLDFLKIKNVKSISPGEIFKRDNSLKIERWNAAKLEKYFYEVPIRNPLMFNMHYFKNILNEVGITVKGGILIKNEVISKELMAKESLPTLKLVELAMEYSNNLFIEILCLKASKAMTLSKAAIDLKVFYKNKFENLGIHHLKFENNSGLSLKLNLRPKIIAQFINQVAMKKYGNRYFITLLSLAGNGGFLSKKFLHSKTHLKFFAKTGSLDYVNGLCSYIISNQKSFCLFINNKKKRSQLVGTNSEKKNQLRSAAKLWKRKTDRYLEKVIIKLFFLKDRLL